MHTSKLHTSNLYPPLIPNPIYINASLSIENLLSVRVEDGQVGLTDSALFGVLALHEEVVNGIIDTVGLVRDA